MSDIHDLKTWRQPFEDVVSGKKTFEIRRNDRDFKVGDTLKLRLFDPAINAYIDWPAMHVHVTHILQGGQFGLDDNFVAMSIKPRDTAA